MNLVTLMFASQKYEERAPKIESICERLNHKIALLGGVQKIIDFWDVASFFEINVVGGIYNLATKACNQMYDLATHTWMLETSMRNIMLIDKIRKGRESSQLHRGSLEAAAAAAQQDPDRLAFEFWSEFFLLGAKEKITALRIPVLVQTTGVARPCHVLVQPGTDRDPSSIEVVGPH